MRPVLYILCGLPFSGKSVLSAAISQKCGFELVSIDAIKTEHGMRDLWENMRSSDWQEIFDESFLLVRHALQRGDSVIHDSANQTRESRDQLRAIARELDVPANVIFVDVPAVVIMQRWQENKRSKERMNLPEWAINAAMANYDPPGDDENVVTYALSDQADPVKWISKNLG